MNFYNLTGALAKHSADRTGHELPGYPSVCERVQLDNVESFRKHLLKTGRSKKVYVS